MCVQVCSGGVYVWHIRGETEYYIKQGSLGDPTPTPYSNKRETAPKPDN